MATKLYLEQWARLALSLIPHAVLSIISLTLKVGYVKQYIQIFR